jgi:hypothetical protein
VNAEKNIAKETVMVPIEVEKFLGITLTLRTEEAEFLVDLMQRIGGDPTRSRRRIADLLSATLRGVGIKPTNTPFYSDITSSAFFEIAKLPLK